MIFLFRDRIKNLVFTRCLNIHGTHVTANIGCLIIHGTHVTANIGCLNIHGTHVTTNNSTNNNVFFFDFRFENSIL